MKDSMDFNQGEVENKSFSFRLVTSSNGNQINVKEERRFSFFFLINLLWVEDSFVDILQSQLNYKFFQCADSF